MEKPKNSEYTREDFWHGRKIKRCVIQGKEITDARVSDDIGDPESFHICQDVVGLIGLDWFGLSAEDTFGYDYTFFMAGADDPLLEEVEFCDEPQSIRDVQKEEKAEKKRKKELREEDPVEEGVKYVIRYYDEKGKMVHATGSEFKQSIFSAYEDAKKGNIGLTNDVEHIVLFREEGDHRYELKRYKFSEGKELND